VAFGEEPNQSPSFLYVNKDTGDVYDAKGNLVQKNSNGSDNTQKQPAQSEAKALPETGETENTGLVASIATVLLAIGSLFTFKR
ncbi:LPXTG cell wall anchor domain-containing protein, partial [Staphylococcus capitis]